MLIFPKGFMTFVPEWLTKSPNLDTGNFMHLWIYLFFFNTLWVWIPLWILYEAHKSISAAFGGTDLSRDMERKKRS